MLDTLTIVLMLVAALLHASWHSLVKFGADREVVLVGMGAVAGALSMLAAPFVQLPKGDVWLVIMASVSLHVGYKFALARSYGLGELGQAFPLARGFVPLFSTVIAFIILGQLPSWSQLTGIAIVSGGLLLLAVYSLRSKDGLPLIVLAVFAGLMVAGYGVVDAYGSRRSGDWLSFTVWLIVTDTLVFGIVIFSLRGPILLKQLWRERFRIWTAGILGLLSFGVFIWALSRNVVGSVSALRESSVVFATLIGMTMHRERPAAAKLASVFLITLGLGLITALR